MVEKTGDESTEDSSAGGGVENCECDGLGEGGTAVNEGAELERSRWQGKDRP
jgi:hypothetical protein